MIFQSFCQSIVSKTESFRNISVDVRLRFAVIPRISIISLLIIFDHIVFILLIFNVNDIFSDPALRKFIVADPSISIYVDLIKDEVSDCLAELVQWGKTKAGIQKVAKLSLADQFRIVKSSQFSNSNLSTWMKEACCKCIEF